MNRAFATFEVKSADDATHTIEGIASTPSADRVGDILDSMGASFNLPLPLLWQHDTHSPIGRVLSARVTKAGIAIKAQLETGILPEIDKAWALIKSGLVRGLSVGFRPLEMEPLNPKEPWGAQRFLKWEWLELSAVTIPANQDASISAIKSLYSPAAAGTRSSSPAAAGSVSARGSMPPTTSDLLTAAQTALTAKSARLQDLVTKQGADGSLEPAEVSERDALTADVESITANVRSLKAIEGAQGQQARPVYAPAPQLDVRQIQQPGLPQVSNPKSNLPPGIGLARAIICRMAALRTGGSAIDIAKEQYRDDPRIAMFLKEDVPAGSTRDNLWAGSLVYAQDLGSEFIDFLRPMTIIGKLEGSMTRVPFNVRINGQTTGANGYWVGEGRAKPLTWFNTAATTLGWYKVANIIAITQDLARFSNPSAETLVRNELAASCQERLDRDFVDPAKAVSTGISPASITNGITNLNSAGTSLANVDTDVAAMMGAFAAAFVMPTHWIMSNALALQTSLLRTSLGARAFPDINMNGGTFMGLPVITSQYMIHGTPLNNWLILCAAPEIFIADDGGFTIDISREASLEMNDAPTMSSGPLGSPAGATGSVVVSMFQTNSLAIRCERFINWARKRSSAVVWMDDVNWGT